MSAVDNNVALLRALAALCPLVNDRREEWYRIFVVGSPVDVSVWATNGHALGVVSLLLQGYADMAAELPGPECEALNALWDLGGPLRRRRGGEHVSDAKPYTVAEVLDDDVVLDWDRTLATVRALEAAEARLGSDGLCGHGASTCERCTDAWSRERRALEMSVAEARRHWFALDTALRAALSRCVDCDTTGDAHCPACAEALRVLGGGR